MKAKARLTVTNAAELCNAPDRILKYVRKVMTLPNPKYEEAVKHDRWTGDLEPELHLHEEIQDGIKFPRGWTHSCHDFLKRNEISFEVIDQRRTLEPVGLTFQGELRDYQEKAVRDVLSRHFGVLSAATGSGKTICALAVIAARQQPTLVLVHTKELLNQWADRIRSFLGTKPGAIGGGKFDLQPVTVATIQTARKHVEELQEHFGFVIGDEIHRVPALQYADVIQGFDSKFILGLSATPYRRDNLSRLIYLLMGDQVHEVDPGELKANGPVHPQEKPETRKRAADIIRQHERPDTETPPADDPPAEIPCDVLGLEGAVDRLRQAENQTYQRWMQAIEQQDPNQAAEFQNWQRALDLLRKAEGNLLELLERRRELLPADEVRTWLSRRVESAKSTLLDMPGKLAPSLENLPWSEIQKALETEVRHALSRLAERIE